MIGGGLPKGSRDIKAARQMFADGMAAILPLPARGGKAARCCYNPPRHAIAERLK